MDSRARNISKRCNNFPAKWGRTGMISGGIAGAAIGGGLSTGTIFMTWLMMENYEKGSASKLRQFVPIVILLGAATSAATGCAAGGLSGYGLGLFKQKIISPQRLAQINTKPNSISFKRI